MTHTPGSWRVSRALWDAETGDVAYIFEGCKEARASDAWLINAAPEMLEVLEKLSLLLVDGEEYVPLELREGMITAIRKARGEE